ncbi:MAG: hypothetical protein ROZ64_15890 [Burkholderiaceae bacterium]|jgi:hypothetical protein|nr:hypothetical protein [Burkholderiaceae bacterium]
MSATPQPTRKRVKAPVLKLVEQRPLADVVGCLQELLVDAARGELVGLAFAAQYRNRFYTYDATGEAYSDPVYARGMISDLYDLLGKRARGE